MRKKEMKVAKMSKDEWMVVRMEELEEWYDLEYLTRDMRWTRDKNEWWVYFSREDALSKFIIKKMRTWEEKTDTTSKQVEEPRGEKQSWSEL